jgi:hypothetical protein
MTITIAERVKNFLTEHEGKPYCDDCIADQLGLRGRQQAQQVTLAFGNTAISSEKRDSAPHATKTDR